MAVTPPTTDRERVRDPGCLDATLLASYIDRQATPHQRARVEAHLSRCYDCYVIVEDSLAAEPVPMPHVGGTSRWTTWVIAGTVAAALLLAVRFAPWPFPSSFFQPAASRVDVAFAQLDEALGPSRIIEPRLSGRSAHRPLKRALRSGTPEALPLDVHTAQLQVADAAKALTDADRERTLATMYLMMDQPEDALKLLEPLAVSASADAGLLSDTAAAYLARREQGDVARAAKIARHAVDIDPTRAEAWFNLGLAAYALGDIAEAGKAWGQYLALDASSPWADEARTRLARATAPRTP